MLDAMVCKRFLFCFFVKSRVVMELHAGCDGMQAIFVMQDALRAESVSDVAFVNR
jgi:hypothetical protein